MPEAPTTAVDHDGETYEFSYEAVVSCEHCENTWPTSSRSRRPTCPSCGRKTDRDVVGAHYHDYIKFLWTGASTLRKQAIRDAGGIPESEVSEHRVLTEGEQDDVVPDREADVPTAEWIDFATTRLRDKANQLEAMVANGWEILDIQDDGHIRLEIDDFEEPDDAVQS